MSGDNKAIMEIPQIHLPRSSFNETFKTYGKIKMNTFTPDFKFRVAPGDTLQVSSDHFFRYNALDVPVLDQIKVQVCMFSFRDRDTFDRADKVYGARYSSRDDDKDYRYFYMANKTLPIFQTAIWSSGATISGTFLGSDRVYNSTLQNKSFPGSDGTDKNISFTQFAELLQKGMPFIQNNVVYRIPFSCTRYNLTTDKMPIVEQEGIHRLIGHAPVGGMYDRLCDVVGDDIKVINPSIIIGTYMIYDKFYRHQLYQDPFIAMDRDVDTDMFCRTDVLSQSGADSYCTVVDFGGFIANRWDENQSSLAQFLFPCTDKKINNVEYFIHKSNVTGRISHSRVGFDVYYKGYEDNENYNKIYAFLNGGLPPVNAKGDYFTLSTLEPQAGEPITIVSESPTNTGTDLNANLDLGLEDLTVVPDGTLWLEHVSGSSGTNATLNIQSRGNDVGEVFVNGTSTGYARYKKGLKLDASQVASTASVIFPDGIPLTTVRQIRLSEILQRFSERTNRTGRRLQELLMAHHGVSLPDDQLREPQCLSIAGSKFDYIPNVQTSQTTAQSPQGNLTANGVGYLHNKGFIKSFDSFGYVVGIVSIIAPRTYQEQYERHLFCFEQFDLFWPEFAGVGDQPVYNYEIFNPSLASGQGKDFIGYMKPVVNTDIANNTPMMYNASEINKRNFNVWGFQERFAERRYKLNKIYDTMRSRAGEVESVPSALTNIKEIPEGSVQDGIFPLVNLNRVALPSEDNWHYALDYDHENVYQAKEGLPFKSDVPDLDSRFIISNVPWKRASFDYDNNPIIMKSKYHVKLTASLPVISIPGLSRTY